METVQRNGADSVNGRPPDKKITVLVDMDGVLCDFDRAVNETYLEMFPSEPAIDLDEDRRHFYMFQNYSEKFGKEAEQRVKKITQAEGFFENLPPIPGALEALREMELDDRVNILICTSPLSFYQFVLREKFAWIEKHLGYEWTKRIVITKDKTVVIGDVLIDDRPAVTGMLEFPHWEHVLFEQPYNRHVMEKRRLKAWTGNEWKQLIDLTWTKLNPEQ